MDIPPHNQVAAEVRAVRLAVACVEVIVPEFHHRGEGTQHDEASDGPVQRLVVRIEREAWVSNGSARSVSCSHEPFPVHRMRSLKMLRKGLPEGAGSIANARCRAQLRGDLTGVWRVVQAGHGDASAVREGGMPCDIPGKWRTCGSPQWAEVLFLQLLCFTNLLQ